MKVIYAAILSEPRQVKCQHTVVGQNKMKHLVENHLPLTNL